MIRYFQNLYALTKEGSKDLLRGIIWTALMDLSFMLPVILGFMFMEEQLSLILGLNAGAPHGFGYYAGFSVLVFVIMFLLAYIQYNKTYTKIYGESAKRRISLAETLRQLPLAFFAQKDIGDLSSMIMEDATQLEMLFSHVVPQMYASFIGVIIITVMLAFYQWQMALAGIWVAPIAFCVFFLSRKWQQREFSKFYFLKREITEQMQEMMDSVQEIKSYHREVYYANKLSAMLDRYEKELIKSEAVMGALMNLSAVILRLGLPSVVLVGMILLIQRTITPFIYIAFLIVAARIYDPMNVIISNLAAITYLNVRIERIKEMDAMPRQTGKTEFAPKGFDICFENVDFSYQDGVQTLKNVSFTAKQGNVTALVGPSGGGKTTVAKLSARFWDINGGKITLGGEDISKIDPEALLKYYSIVFQDVTLFNSSVMENIRLGRKDASDEDVIRAARLAQCDEFVSRLPQGYQTLIGENGEKLSGGERQRISIARAILKDAPVILLDEATASLDAENETKIQWALSELVKEKTVLVIAHRLRTIAGADQVVTIKDGKVVDIVSA